MYLGGTVFEILVRTHLVLTELLHGSLQSLQSYIQVVPHTMPRHPFQFHHPAISFYVNQTTA